MESSGTYGTCSEVLLTSHFVEGHPLLAAQTVDACPLARSLAFPAVETSIDLKYIGHWGGVGWHGRSRTALLAAVLL